MKQQQKSSILDARIKHLNETESSYNVGALAKKDKEIFEYVMEITKDFPSKISFSKRFRAVASGNDCKCPVCGTVHGNLSRTVCSMQCRDVYTKNKRGNYSYEEIIKAVEGFSLKEISTTERPDAGFLPTDKDSFVFAFNKIDSLSNEELADIMSNFDVNASINIRGNRIRRLHIWLIKIATHNKNVTDYFKQVVLCAKYPKKSDNLEYWTLVYGEEYAKYKMNKKSNRVKGKNNPAFDHGGKFSPFSKKFIKGDVVEETAKKAVESRNNNNTNNARLSFWTERFGQEEGERLYYERQNTFSLEKLVKKHGEEEGTRIWEERQQKWLKSLSELPEEEKILINAKKGFWRYTDPLTDAMDEDVSENQVDTKLYMIEYQPVGREEVYIKIGVTSKKYMTDRFPSISIKNVICIHVADRHTNFSRERDIKKFIFQNNLNILIESEQGKFDGWTECVDIKYKDKLIEVVDEAIRNNPS